MAQGKNMVFIDSTPFRTYFLLVERFVSVRFARTLKLICCVAARVASEAGQMHKRLEPMRSVLQPPLQT